MFVSQDKTTSNHANKNEGKQMVNIVLCDHRFLKFIQYCLKCVTPLVKVLRLVEGDTKHVMSYNYEVMDRAKEQLSTYLRNQNSRYKKGLENN